MSRGRYEIVRTNAGYHVRTIGANGEPLSSSETLSTHAACTQNIEAQIEVAREVGLTWRVVDEREQGDEQ